LVTRAQPSGSVTTLVPLDTIRFWDRLDLASGARLEILAEGGLGTSWSFAGPRVVSFDTDSAGANNSGPRPGWGKELMQIVFDLIPAAVCVNLARPPSNQTVFLLALVRNLVVSMDARTTGALVPLSPVGRVSTSRPSLAWGFTSSPVPGSRIRLRVEDESWPAASVTAGTGIQVYPFPLDWPGLQSGRSYRFLFECSSPADKGSAAPGRITAEHSETVVIGDGDRAEEASPKTDSPADALVAAWLKANELSRLSCHSEALLELLPWIHQGPRTQQRRLFEAALASQLGAPLELLRGPSMSR
jgi:hypothetical protein